MTAFPAPVYETRPFKLRNQFFTFGGTKSPGYSIA